LAPGYIFGGPPLPELGGSSQNRRVNKLGGSNLFF